MDGIPRAEALAAQKRLAALLSYKLKREYSEMCGFVWARMSLTIVSYLRMTPEKVLAKAEKEKKDL